MTKVLVLVAVVGLLFLVVQDSYAARERTRDIAIPVSYGDPDGPAFSKPSDGYGAFGLVFHSGTLRDWLEVRASHTLFDDFVARIAINHQDSKSRVDARSRAKQIASTTR